MDNKYKIKIRYTADRSDSEAEGTALAWALARVLAEAKGIDPLDLEEWWCSGLLEGGRVHGGVCPADGGEAYWPQIELVE